MIMEDEEKNWQLLLAIIPAARTPMDKKSGKALQKWSGKIRREISRFLTPWVEHERIQMIRERMKKPPEGVVYNEDGSVADLNDPDWWKKS